MHLVLASRPLSMGQVAHEHRGEGISAPLETWPLAIRPAPDGERQAGHAGRLNKPMWYSCLALPGDAGTLLGRMSLMSQLCGSGHCAGKALCFSRERSSPEQEPPKGQGGTGSVWLFFFFHIYFFFLGNRQISEGFGLVCLFVFPGSRLFGSIPSKHSAVPVLSAFARPASAAVSVAACFCAIWGNPLRQAAQR